MVNYWVMRTKMQEKILALQDILHLMLIKSIVLINREARGIGLR